ncbi:MAG: sigma-54-dependent Fis family transcriptional regulator [Betaproteobacteria bacterium]|nr:sigma-54-dependent Fis family transcriptional regulator [Betaproteobacteria bacterium]
MPRLLIVDDDAGFRESLTETLESLGHEVVAVESGTQGLASIRQGGIAAAFLDFRLPDASGLDILRQMLAQPVGRGIPVIMLTAYASADNTIEAMKLGAFDHLAKPVGRQAIEKVLVDALQSRVTPGQRTAGVKAHEFLAHSDPMREVVKLIGRAATTDATVLITGETGTGKEEVARALHQHSARADKPFVAINCAAIPHDLLENELFGHVRGAFTGATAARTGIFQQADGGTLLLDEIGDMSAALQAKLLRVLQEGVVVPVGGESGVAVDVRILAATHRDLDQRVRDGDFRQDLFYRLNVLNIRVPPLCERGEDVIALAEHFLALAGDPPKTLTAAAHRALEAHNWPGNVRELKNVIERASVLARGAQIDMADLGLAGPSPVLETEVSDLPTALSRLEADMIRKALAESGGNRAEAARRLGIHRQLLYAKLRQHGIEP